METATVPVTSAWTSKVNWTQGVSAFAMILTFLSGGHAGLSPDQQAAVVVTIGVVCNVATWAMKTFFTDSVHAASLPNGSTGPTVAHAIAIFVLAAAAFEGWGGLSAQAAETFPPSGVIQLAQNSPLAPPVAKGTATAPAVKAAATTTRHQVLSTGQAQENPLLLLQQFTVTDLNAAIADAQAQTPPDTTAVTCYTAVLALVNSNVANPLPTTPGLFEALQKARDAKALLANIASPTGPLANLNNACAPLILSVQNTLLGLGVAVGLVANPVGAPVALAGIPAAVATFLALPKL